MLLFCERVLSERTRKKWFHKDFLKRHYNYNKAGSRKRRNERDKERFKFLPQLRFTWTANCHCNETFSSETEISVNHVIESCIRWNELLCEIKLAKLIVLVLILFSHFSSSSISRLFVRRLACFPSPSCFSNCKRRQSPFFATDHRHDVRHSSKANISFVVFDALHSKPFFAGFLSALISRFRKLYADDGLFHFSSWIIFLMFFVQFWLPHPLSSWDVNSGAATIVVVVVPMGKWRKNVNHVAWLTIFLRCHSLLIGCMRDVSARWCVWLTINSKSSTQLDDDASNHILISLSPPSFVVWLLAVDEWIVMIHFASV